MCNVGIAHGCYVFQFCLVGSMWLILSPLQSSGKDQQESEEWGVIFIVIINA